VTDTRSIAEALRAAEPALVTSLDFGPFVAQGCGVGPAVIIGDPSEIRLFTPTTGGGLEYRMSLLAHAGDVVLVRQRDRAFETYLAEQLGLVDVSFIEMGQGHEASIAHLARKTLWLVEHLAEMAVQQGGLTLKPYITTGHIWRLAQLIGEIAQTTVHVCGPSPRVARRANDKLWLSDLVHQVIGRAATPPTFSSYGPAATAGLVAHIARTAEQVIVKVPDSAGSAGNIGLQSTDIQGRSLADVRSFLLDSLHACGWADTYPVLVGVWDAGVVCSPSAQLWIPELSQGPPVCEGVFEQSVVGRQGRFVGAVRSTLPIATQAALTDQAMRLASVLQRIGYFGRCSFDAVIQRRGTGPDVIHWIECNGRWGGVSIPLSALQNRCDSVPDGLVIAQVNVLEVHLTTAEVLDRLTGLLSLGPSKEGLTLTAPAKAANGTLFSAYAVAGSDTAARALMAEGNARLRGLDAR
jgi:hypothetical protein